MDKKLKERLVGAALLVLAGVLVVPLLLDGPEPDVPRQRSDIRLPAAEEGERLSRTVRLEQPRQSPMARPEERGDPADDRAQPTAPQREPQSEPRVSAAPPPVAEPVAPPPADDEFATEPSPEQAEPPRASADPAVRPGSDWVVQLGSFSQRANAERLAEELRGKRYQSFVTRYDRDGTTLHRVRVGPAGSREEADEVVARLAEDGYRGQPVRE